MATQSEINASLGLPPGINPDGSWNAQDYIARRIPGQVDTKAQVDAALAARNAIEGKVMGLFEESQNKLPNEMVLIALTEKIPKIIKTSNGYEMISI